MNILIVIVIIDKLITSSKIKCSIDFTLINNNILHVLQISAIPNSNLLKYKNCNKCTKHNTTVYI